MLFPAHAAVTYLVYRLHARVSGTPFMGSGVLVALGAGLLPDLGVAFAVGYSSHVAADLVDLLFVPDESAAFLLWPFASGYGHTHEVHDLLHATTPPTYLAAQAALTLGAVLVWLRDGTPGAEPVARWLSDSE